MAAKNKGFKEAYTKARQRSPTSIQTFERNPLHPVIKRVMGAVLTASAHPHGFIEGFKEVGFQEVMRKSYEWMTQERGRSFIVTNYTNNNATQIHIRYFDANGKEHKPFGNF